MTLAELTVMFVIMAVVIMATLGISKTKTDKIKAYQYYAAFTNLKQAVGEVFADGYRETPESPIEKQLTPYGHTGENTGICDRLAEVFNTIGKVDCTISGGDNFSDENVNFTLTNGERFFNIGKDIDGEAFRLYIDIDGKKGKSVLDEDVMEFRIYRNGTVLPGETSIGGNNKNYLSASIKEINTNTWDQKDIPYLKAVCNAGEMPESYCTPLGIPLKENCTSPNVCQVYINKP
ncbi:MAG TPA: hypothetical protein PLG15_05685 [Candidatus Gastranaerophilaceae bacterium]|nr:hypothetical protein [Candidatus Gastranaerophilaceae bacterium]HPT41856.1 hypothetical protein [Candidatus Gastranaerophilaceae bacterium]